MAQPSIVTQQSLNAGTDFKDHLDLRWRSATQVDRIAFDRVSILSAAAKSSRARRVTPSILPVQRRLEHDAEKCAAVFRKHHAQTKT
jgi:hypothetical protein